MSKNFFLVSYDIVNDKIRKKISDTLLDFGGRRVQYSVFECELTPANYEKLCKKLHELRKASDSIRTYFLCKRCQQRMRADEDAELRERMPEWIKIV
ncbi:MAG: CRISPR-associated endonuclease Cas2 [bacterium]